MSDRLPVEAPYRRVIVDGVEAPFYVIPFDKDGLCTGPLTQRSLIERVREATPTDVFLFSHGWNNDWAAATSRYDKFLDGFAALRTKYPLTREFRPTLIGVFWPSTSLVAPWEQAPNIAGGVPGSNGAAIAVERAEVALVAEAVEPRRRARFYEIAQRPTGLEEAEVAELAELLEPIWALEDHEAGAQDAPASDEIARIWRSLPAQSRPETDFGFAEESGRSPQAAGWLGRLDLRGIIRLATVLLMKDRAGRVGSRGVAELLDAALSAAPNARVHLIGHSYGCKVMLSALCARPQPRSVESLLLLQAAVSRRCFAQNADGAGKPGGYRPALDLCRLPIYSTYSRWDVPLTRFFHLAVRRNSDVGEMQIAAEPSRFAALGGFGPADSPEVVVRPARLPPETYTGSANGHSIVALESSAVIAGHGEINNEATWWMLLNQVAGAV
ncbi:hypothetical protein AB5J56_00470 [Streptomyces sp. R21]|uniref:Serine-threonine protein kinase n=1 Tax=Streptomyces sp. R21 TaxID=3238627 RepID=A0AB39NZF7_9ACTN